MRHVVAVYCSEALIGFGSPISYYSDANLQKSINLLRYAGCNHVLIGLDQMEQKKRDLVETYLKEYVLGLDQQLQSRVAFSVSAKPFAQTVVDYIRYFPGEVCVDIFAKREDRRLIAEQINIHVCKEAISKTVIRKMPTVFTM
jgi:hypothetical protein